MGGKEEQRRLALAARRGLTAQQRREKSAEICRRLAELPQLRAAGVLLSYVALWDEADLSALHEELLRAGKVLAFPVTEPGGRMEARAAAGPEALRTGRYGILEPDPALSRPVPPRELQLILLPCVAFDGALMRLGRGAGYYDRYLARCPQALRVAAAFEVQRLPAVSAQAHDEAMDLVVTERETLRRAGQRAVN